MKKLVFLSLSLLVMSRTYGSLTLTNQIGNGLAETSSVLLRTVATTVTLQSAANHFNVEVPGGPLTTLTLATLLNASASLLNHPIAKITTESAHYQTQLKKSAKDLLAAGCAVVGTEIIGGNSRNLLLKAGAVAITGKMLYDAGANAIDQLPSLSALKIS